MKKQILAAAVAGGLALGGLGFAGVAVAGPGSEDRVEPASEIQFEAQADGIENIQFEEGQGNDGPNGDNDGDNDRRRNRGGKSLGAAAEAIGVSGEDLRAALEAGDTIADVAEANGVAPQDVIDALVDASAERLDAKVADGRLTQAEADEKLADKAERISNKVFGIDNDGETDNIGA